VEETAPRCPSYTVLMLVLTAALVGLSLAFNARILDALGGRPNDQQLSTIETWTQLLLGCGLTLMLWGTLVLPRMERSRLSWRMRWLVLVIAGVIGSGAGVALYQATEDLLLWNGDGWAGRRAVQLHALTHGLTDSNVLAHDIDVPAELLITPTGRAFLSLLMTTELRRHNSLVATPASLGTLLEGMLTQRIGTAAQVYDNVFVPSVRSLRDAYNAYVDAQMAFAEDVRAIPEKQAQLWQEQQDAAARRMTTAQRLAGGIPTDAVTPPDRAAFMANTSAQLREIADSQYNDRVVRLFGARLPTGLEWDQFVAHPIVQSRWRAAIDAPESATLSATMGFQAFSDNVYRPMLERIVRPRLESLTAPAERFATGGPMAREAERAMRWIVVPVLALGFSLLVIVWHGAALAIYLGTVTAPRWRSRRRVILLGLFVAGIAVLGARSAVTRTDGFTRLENWLADQAGPVWLVARAGVETEDLVYLWGNRIRRIVLGSHDFGLESFSRRPDESQGSLDRLTP